MDSQQTKTPTQATQAQAAAALAVSSALESIQSGNFDLAVQPLQHALSLLTDPLGATGEIVRDAERFREFAEAAGRDDGSFERAVLGFPAKNEQTSSLNYFRALVDFATIKQHAYRHKGLVS